MEATTRNKDTDTGNIQPIAVGPAGVRALLGGINVSDVTLWRWEKAGLLQRVPHFRGKLWTIESVRRMVEGKAGK